MRSGPSTAEPLPLKASSQPVPDIVGRGGKAPIADYLVDKVELAKSVSEGVGSGKAVFGQQ